MKMTAQLIMRTWTLFFVSVLSLGAFPNQAAAAPMGGRTDGGGCFYRGGSGELTILDFAEHRELNNLIPNPADRISTTPTMLKLGFDKLDLHHLNSWRRAREIIAAHHPETSFFANTLLRALDKLEIRMATPYRFLQLPPRCTTSVAPRQNIEAAVFFQSGLGMALSIKTFNELTFTNQVALWIHEAGRYLQFDMQEQTSEDQLRQMTLQLIVQNIRNDAAQDLDHRFQLSGPLQSTIAQSDQLLREISKVCSSIHRQTQSLPAEMSQNINLICGLRPSPDSEVNSKNADLISTTSHSIDQVYAVSCPNFATTAPCRTLQHWLTETSSLAVGFSHLAVSILSSDVRGSMAHLSGGQGDPSLEGLTIRISEDILIRYISGDTRDLTSSELRAARSLAMRVHQIFEDEIRAGSIAP